ncbi:hypothetical protein HDU76_009344 [Blyttiomyces sp. JEL0837]|nr:hypothetical protein HDU76_009344 [Blyttiomyces sp. JEL0837]
MNALVHKKKFKGGSGFFQSNCKIKFTFLAMEDFSTIKHESKLGAIQRLVALLRPKGLGIPQHPVLLKNINLKIDYLGLCKVTKDEFLGNLAMSNVTIQSLKILDCLELPMQRWPQIDGFTSAQDITLTARGTITSAQGLQGQQLHRLTNLTSLKMASGVTDEVFVFLVGALPNLRDFKFVSSEIGNVGKFLCTCEQSVDPPARVGTINVNHMRNLTELGLELVLPFTYNTGSDFDDGDDISELYVADLVTKTLREITKDVSTIFPSLLTLVISVKRSKGSSLFKYDPNVMGSSDSLSEILKRLDDATRLRRVQFEFLDKGTHATFFSLLDGDGNGNKVDSRMRVEAFIWWF